MNLTTRILGLAAMLGAGSLMLGHFAWIGPVAAPLKVGETAKVHIGNGHDFPGSESPLSQDKLSVWAVAPSGAKMEVAVAPAEKHLMGTFPVKEAGVYRIVFTHDRGVFSKTTKGFKPGGRDMHPEATESYKLYRTAISYAATSGKAFGKEKPLGLLYEMVPEKTGEGVVVTVLAGGKPCAGAKISVVWPNKEDEEVGQTGADGKFLFKMAAGTKGPVLLLADHKTPAPKGAPYDTENWAGALALYW
ncbi:MAG: DUF4198 domain-containing protein [Bryobacteraceae bacterium]|nr:DUF4198 domain-containing protein [Bryobacteraceae bacterium]